MKYQSIPTVEQAREDKFARIIWSASKQMKVYTRDNEFASGDMMGGAIAVNNPDEVIENCKFLNIEVFREREDFSGFDKI